MKPLAPDEKTVPVMVYTYNMLVRGDVIVKENVRVSIWLRTQGVPNYVHIVKPQVVLFGGATPKPLSLSEVFVPTARVQAFHLAPPAQDPMDYEEGEVSRMMQPVELVVGTFLMKAKIRISTQTDVATSLDVMRAAWVSIYDAEISNPQLSQFGMKVPMMLVNPNEVSFGMA